MLKAFASLSKRLDKFPKIQKSLNELAKSEVYVGIPEGDVGDHHDITNPQLMYVFSHGVRSKEMREEMNEYMGVTPGGMPIMRDFEKFSSNMGKGMPYSAAYELYLQEHGSPLWHSPPRPVLEPAIKNNQDKIAEQLKIAAQIALGGTDPSTQLQKTGMMATNFAKAWFYDPKNKWPPNAPATIKQKGSDRTGIDTGNLRNSITYVVGKKS